MDRRSPNLNILHSNIPHKSVRSLFSNFWFSITFSWTQNNLFLERLIKAFLLSNKEHLTEFWGIFGYNISKFGGNRPITQLEEKNGFYKTSIKINGKVHLLDKPMDASPMICIMLPHIKVFCQWCVNVTEKSELWIMGYVLFY